MASLRFSALFVLAVAACATAGKSDQQPPDDAPITKMDADLTVDANNCPNQPCDILTQCGCAANAACDVDVSDLDGGACRSVSANARPEGGDCAGGASACQPGLVCLGNAPAVCRKFCDASADCGQPRGQCVIEITDGTNPIPNIPNACSSNCDPTNVAAGGCPANTKCGLFTQTFNGADVPVVDCDAAGAGVQGTNCEVGTTNTGNDALCGPNFLCTTVDASATFQCRRTCIVGGAGICGGGETCIPFNPPFIIAGTNYGVCN